MQAYKASPILLAHFSLKNNMSTLLGEENTKLDKLGNTVSTESSEDASPPTKKEQRAAERKAQLGLAGMSTI